MFKKYLFLTDINEEMLSFEKQAWCCDLIFKIVFLKCLAILIQRYFLIKEFLFA